MLTGSTREASFLRKLNSNIDKYMTLCMCRVDVPAIRCNALIFVECVPFIVFYSPEDERMKSA